MFKNVNSEGFEKILDWAYGRSLEGIPGGKSAKELAEEYLRRNKGDVRKACESLIRWQTSKGALVGFMTGLGGLTAMTVAIPANVASALYIQIRMIAAIASMCGCDLNSDQVRSLVYFCLTGNAIAEIAKDVGVNSLARSTMKWLGKSVPVVGGVVCGLVDLTSTKAIGELAKEVFINQSVHHRCNLV